MKGKITYSKLGTKHVSLVQKEIVFRGHTFDVKEGIRKLAKQLKTINLERQRKHLIHTTGNEHRSAAVYGLH